MAFSNPFKKTTEILSENFPIIKIQEVKVIYSKYPSKEEIYKLIQRKKEMNNEIN